MLKKKITRLFVIAVIAAMTAMTAFAAPGDPAPYGTNGTIYSWLNFGDMIYDANGIAPTSTVYFNDEGQIGTGTQYTITPLIVERSNPGTADNNFAFRGSDTKISASFSNGYEIPNDKLPYIIIQVPETVQNRAANIQATFILKANHNSLTASASDRKFILEASETQDGVYTSVSAARSREKANSYTGALATTYNYFADIPLGKNFIKVIYGEYNTTTSLNQGIMGFAFVTEPINPAGTATFEGLKNITIDETDTTYIKPVAEAPMHTTALLAGGTLYGAEYRVEGVIPGNNIYVNELKNLRYADTAIYKHNTADPSHIILQAPNAEYLLTGIDFITIEQLSPRPSFKVYKSADLITWNDVTPVASLLGYLPVSANFHYKDIALENARYVKIEFLDNPTYPTTFMLNDITISWADKYIANTGDGNFSINFSPYGQAVQGNAILASYNNTELVDVKIVPDVNIASDEIGFIPFSGLDTTNCTVVKGFILDDNLSPQCPAFQLDL